MRTAQKHSHGFGEKSLPTHILGHLRGIQEAATTNLLGCTTRPNHRGIRQPTARQVAHERLCCRTQKRCRDAPNTLIYHYPSTAGLRKRTSFPFSFSSSLAALCPTTPPDQATTQTHSTGPGAPTKYPQNGSHPPATPPSVSTNQSTTHDVQQRLRE